MKDNRRTFIVKMEGHPSPVKVKARSLVVGINTATFYSHDSPYGDRYDDVVAFFRGVSSVVEEDALAKSEQREESSQWIWLCDKCGEELGIIDTDGYGGEFIVRVECDCCDFAADYYFKFDRKVVK